MVNSHVCLSPTGCHEVFGEVLFGSPTQKAYPLLILPSVQEERPDNMWRSNFVVQPTLSIQGLRSQHCGPPNTSQDFGPDMLMVNESSCADLNRLWECKD